MEFDLSAAQAKIAAAEAALVAVVEAAADARLAAAVEEFRVRFPRWGLSLEFGNGTEAGTLWLADGSRRDFSFALDDDDHYVTEVGERNAPGYRLTDRPYDCLGFLAAAIEDIIALTDGYRKGSPSDVEVKTP